MNLLELIKKEYIELNLSSEKKEDAIKELLTILNQQHQVNDFDALYVDVLKREALGSTGVGFGIAIPHSKSPYVNSPSLVFGKSQKGIDFQSFDEAPAHLIFLIAVPENSPDLHLKVLASLSRKLIDETFRESLLNAKTKEEVLDVLKDVG